MVEYYPDVEWVTETTADVFYHGKKFALVRTEDMGWIIGKGGSVIVRDARTPEDALDEFRVIAK